MTKKNPELLIPDKYPRITPACKDFGVCNGCSFQNISYEDEVSLKEERTLELFENADIKGFSYKGFLTANPCGYKNKMEFSFGDTGKGGDMALGIGKKNRYYEVITPMDCTLIDEDYKKIVSYALEFFKNSSDPIYHKRSATGTLRYLVVRKTLIGQIMVNIVTTSTLKADLTRFVYGLAALELKGFIASVLHTINDTKSDAIKPDDIITLQGSSYIKEELFGLSFMITHSSFFQTNSRGALILYDIIRGITKDLSCENVYDLFSGVGTIAQIISPFAENVTGIELIPEAVLAAKESAIENKIYNCSFIAADVHKALAELQRDQNSPCLIIIDPPRMGLHPKALREIKNTNTENIIYISCNPNSLIRDIAELENYNISSLWFVDMFPRTPHVESVVHLRRR